MQPGPCPACRHAGSGRAEEEARRRTLAHWHHLQTRWPEFRRFRLRGLAPALGVREGCRIVAERTLTQHDIIAGLAGQRDDDLITIADHGMDAHGAKAGAYSEVRSPYGVPFRCLVPRGWRNLLVACRAAGFSSLAASSCRLTRTMMQLGQAAGTAAALAGRLGCDPAAVPGPQLRAALSAQGVQLAWPMEPAVMARIGAGMGDHRRDGMTSSTSAVISGQPRLEGYLFLHADRAPRRLSQPRPQRPRGAVDLDGGSRRDASPWDLHPGQAG